MRHSSSSCMTRMAKGRARMCFRTCRGRWPLGFSPSTCRPPRVPWCDMPAFGKCFPGTRFPVPPALAPQRTHKLSWRLFLLGQCAVSTASATPASDLGFCCSWVKNLPWGCRLDCSWVQNLQASAAARLPPKESAQEPWRLCVGPLSDRWTRGLKGPCFLAGCWGMQPSHLGKHHVTHE